MYIPTTFMSTQGSCFTVTTSAINGNGTISSGSFISGGIIWDYYQFEMTDKENVSLTSFTASLNILSGSTGQAKVLIVGAGGSGGFGAGSGTSQVQNYAAGGGGGGGVVYYNNFPLSSGSIEIGVGGAVQTAAITSTGSNGRNSYIKRANNLSYPPFTGSLIAYGGGGGGWGELDSIFPFTCRSFNGTPGPTTGGVGIYSGQCPAGTADATLYSTLNGLTFGPQGYRGGNIDETEPDFTVIAGSGGGGAATIAPQLTYSQMAFGLYASNGGDGLQFNMNGTPTYFSPGGGGQGGASTTPDTGATGLGGNTYGRGGQAERDGAGGTINRGFGGIVIIAIPQCVPDAKDCTEYRILGGATGGTINYIPCGTQTLTSSSIDFGFTGSICTYKVGGYPTSTGTVTLTQTGSCNTFIPLQPTVTCTGGQVKTPVYLWNYTLTGTCYPTPSSCQRYFFGYNEVGYTNADGVYQVVNVGNFFSNTSTQVGSVCARDIPVPTLNGFPTLTKTSLVCGYFCSGSI